MCLDSTKFGRSPSTECAFPRLMSLQVMLKGIWGTAYTVRLFSSKKIDFFSIILFFTRELFASRLANVPAVQNAPFITPASLKQVSGNFSPSDCLITSALLTILSSSKTIAEINDFKLSSNPLKSHQFPPSIPDPKSNRNGTFSPRDFPRIETHEHEIL